MIGLYTYGLHGLGYATHAHRDGGHRQLGEYVDGGDGDEQPDRALGRRVRLAQRAPPTRRCDERADRVRRQREQRAERQQAAERGAQRERAALAVADELLPMPPAVDGELVAY